MVIVFFNFFASALASDEHFTSSWVTLQVSSTNVDCICCYSGRVSFLLHVIERYTGREGTICRGSCHVMASKRTFNVNGVQLELDEPQLQFDDDELLFDDQEDLEDDCR